jgi:hypothetical protein
MKIKINQNGKINKLCVAQVKRSLGLGSNYRFMGAEPAPNGGTEYGVLLRWECVRGARRSFDYPEKWFPGKLVSGRITKDFAAEP